MTRNLTTDEVIHLCLEQSGKSSRQVADETGINYNTLHSMSGYKVDHNQVIEMSKYHPNAVIADRLGISFRQVRRILASHGLNNNDARKKFVDRQLEDMMLNIERKLGYSYEKIAYRHGLSRQAVHQRINDN